MQGGHILAQWNVCHQKQDRKSSMGTVSSHSTQTERSNWNEEFKEIRATVLLNVHCGPGTGFLGHDNM